ncbi:glutamine amidotransferase class-I-domain-containing protein [Protomyces lactucae-debilis]|uniref:anthranilate synthase n=1 Tax=Protomyces lactucae-debilis TaxID=2754530 RepID=A0A1Y2FK07_PROLT|nr:glutamine amidotransferase class-I-domain-containing protein [Protomyces lactucae-debilis]ORY84269.1 glutamine amidotransferase class-I-domain-containing protein [Protomyces lactucae-debilis]
MHVHSLWRHCRRYAEILHEKTFLVEHNGKGLYTGVSQKIAATRYHSLAGTQESLPACLERTSWTKNGIIMGFRHKEYAMEGVQYHLESILSEAGKMLFANLLKLEAGTWASNPGFNDPRTATRDIAASKATPGSTPADSKRLFNYEVSAAQTFIASSNNLRLVIAVAVATYAIRPRQALLRLSSYSLRIQSCLLLSASSALHSISTTPFSKPVFVGIPQHRLKAPETQIRKSSINQRREYELKMRTRRFTVAGAKRYASPAVISPQVCLTQLQSVIANKHRELTMLMQPPSQ